MIKILKEEKPYLLYKELHSGEAKYNWLLRRAENISWATFWRFVPWKYFQMTDPFNFYRLSKVRTLDIYKDFSPLLIGRKYIVKIILLYHYGILYIFVPNGNEGWFNKAVHDIDEGITKTRLIARLRKDKSEFPDDKKTNMQRKLSLDNIVEIRYGTSDLKVAQMARKYGVNPFAIDSIKSGIYWKYI